jgi:hypothetical protein
MKNIESATAPAPVSSFNGLDIASSVQRLRTYHCVERRCIKVLAGWFLRAPAYETKYGLAYHLWDHAEHVTWLRARLVEMRGGQPDASVAPGLRAVLDETLHAPDTDAMLRGLYGVIKRDLLAAYREHLKLTDAAANASEIRLLRRIIPEIEAQLAWYDSLNLENGVCPWQEYIRAQWQAVGGISGERQATPAPPFQGGENGRTLTTIAGAAEGARSSPPFERGGSKPLGESSPNSFAPPTRTLFARPKTILFDQRIRIGELTPYDVRKTLDSRAATVEQFKVFFNELYAAALLASILFDAFDDGYPWEFYSDFAHHFWDEVRHSEFGALRLTELGERPSVCNPTLFEASESMPVLHRICYLTLGLEVYFMPRKQPRVKEYMNNGDQRSQLFADQDWSDETNHVRYGKKWIEFLLTDDQREVEDLQLEIRAHLERVTGRKHETVSAPY